MTYLKRVTGERRPETGKSGREMLDYDQLGINFTKCIFEKKESLLES